MAKIIKYQIATEVSYKVIVKVPLLGEDGNPVVNEIKTPVTEEVIIPLLDENREPLLDENGEPMVKVVTRPVYDENGEPVVEVTYEPVFTYEPKQEIKTVFSNAIIECSTQESFDANLPMVQKEAYNGKYTVEDDGKPDPVAEPTTDEILNAMLGVSV